MIDWLVRKPGAFENYRYREDLFPTSRFRVAYDELRETVPGHASREYLQILQLAARENESWVDDALRFLLDNDQPITARTVREWVEAPGDRQAGHGGRGGDVRFVEFRCPFLSQGGVGWLRKRR